MAASATSLEFVEKMYLAYFGRPAAPTGQEYYATLVDAGNLAALQDDFWNSAESQALFGGLSTEGKVAAIFNQLFARDPALSGLTFWTNEINSGRVSLPQAALTILNSAAAADLAVFNAKLEVATAFTAELDTTAEVLAFQQNTADARDLLSSVDNAAEADVVVAGITATVAAMLAAPVVPNTAVSLTTGLDVLTGTSLDNQFNANVVQNALGAQVNTLGSGDTLVGGAGTDTLSAKITAGAFINGGINGGAGGETMPIQPETNSIELISLQAVNATINSDNTEVFVNAKDMHGVTKIASNHSDANLTIQNLTTLNDSGSARSVSEMTVGMEYTGNDDSAWNESDFTVYFDQDYLTTTVANTRPGIVLQVMNEDAYDLAITGGATQAQARDQALASVYMNKVLFTLNGVDFDLASGVAGVGGNSAVATRIQSVEPKEGDGSEIETYTELVAAMEVALQGFKDANPANAALQTMTVALGDAFLTATNDLDPNFQQRLGTEINLTVDFTTAGVDNSLTILPSSLQITQADDVLPGQTANHRLERTDVIDTTSSTNLEINVDLEKVGLAGDGGELVIGSMNKTTANEWNAVNTVTDTVSGIHQFNVTVFGANDKSSSLSGMHSTNNNLRTVNVVTDAAQTVSFADLTIGNSNTGGLSDVPSIANLSALKDVQTFDASGLQGDLTLFAGLSDEVTAKYLNVVDDAANAAADNVDFVYTGGTGDDYINLYLDGANLAQPGTSSREDMTLTVSGGAGDDEIVTMIDEGGTANWYINQQINANLSIGLNNTVATGQLQLNGGDGADTIRNMGTGDFAINAGTGDDTVYADNTGDFSTWTINAVNNDPVDLQSQPAVAAATGIANLFLNVSFKGYDKEVAVGGSNGSLVGVSVTDLTINQAIKDAINNDAVLNKLLIATDGPARTLVITSLIDGVQSGLDDINDVVISLSSTALTAGQAVNAAQLSGLQAAALGFDATTFVAVGAGRFDANDTGDGTNSAETSDSLIVGGTGDDVIVLSTGTNSNEGVGYAGFVNGTDYIVNFDTTVVPTTTDVLSVALGESFTVTFADLVPTGAASITFDDSGAIPLGNALIPAEDVAFAFVEGYIAGAGTNWTVTVVPGTATVNFVATATGNLTPDVVAADFVFANATGTPVVSAYVQGTDAFAAAEAQVFTVDFATTVATAAGTIDLSALDGLAATTGVSVAYVIGDGPITLAAAVAAGAYADWTTVNNLDGTVTFTANVAGLSDVALDTAAELDLIFDNGTNGLAAASDTTTALDGNQLGVAQVGTITTTIVEAFAALDYLDFTSYGAEAVYVDGVLVTGAAALVGEEYITLVESATNDGEYTMTLRTEAGATDTVVGVIGVADFGDTQAFVANNFVIA